MKLRKMGEKNITEKDALLMVIYDVIISFNLPDPLQEYPSLQEVSLT